MYIHTPEQTFFNLIILGKSRFPQRSVTTLTTRVGPLFRKNIEIFRTRLRAASFITLTTGVLFEKIIEISPTRLRATSFYLLTFPFTYDKNTRHRHRRRRQQRH